MREQRRKGMSDSGKENTGTDREGKRKRVEGGKKRGAKRERWNM